MRQTAVAHEAADPAMADHRCRAVRFFWAVLILASTGSIVGNATHAVLNAPAVPAAVAAAVAIAPPLVLLACTEGVALLLKAKPPTSSATFWWAALYWAVLLMTVALAVAAFMLSFDALRDLAIRAGVHSDRAWLWPLVVDVSIALSTLCLLALSPVQAGQSTHHRPGDVDDDQAGSDTADANCAHHGLPVQGRREHARTALAVVRTKRTKQPPGCGGGGAAPLRRWGQDRRDRRPDEPSPHDGEADCEQRAQAPTHWCAGAAQNRASGLSGSKLSARTSTPPA